MAEEAAPIIIKKIKKYAGGHHGGAWKVAYADFVTAMMAFFLLLWLLSSTSEATKEGIAEYFTPTIGLKDSMGIGFEGGETPNTEGKRKSDLAPPGIVAGRPLQGVIPEKPDTESLVESTEESKLFEKAQENINKTFEEDPNFRELRDNVIVEQSPEGLKIQVMDLDKHPMFEPGKSVLTEYGERMLKKITEVVVTLPNHISITGHTDSSGYAPGAEYTNWELSADRANASRRYMQTVGLETARVGKVVGMADRELLEPTDPKSAKNRRITIILLRGSFMNLSDAQRPAVRGLLTVPRVEEKRPAAPAVVPEKAPEPASNTAPNEMRIYKPQMPEEGKGGAMSLSPMPGVMPRKQEEE